MVRTYNDEAWLYVELEKQHAEIVLLEAEKDELSYKLDRIPAWIRRLFGV